MALKCVTGLTAPCALVFHDLSPPCTGVRIQGSVPSDCQRFSVDFCCGEETNHDVAFHFNPRFDQNTVVCNSFQNQKWQSEQTNAENPFRHETCFQLDFSITNEHFEVLVNNEVFERFRHRIPLCHVKVLEVGPKVDIHKIEFF
ncbi:galectin-7-like [Alligator sinensis]|uniref:Galectin n=1 Tax=Alligator sinensis TaxID=38654 RepID=A0A1U7SUR0_ALLSI|nr:galectin-7-like [Alligator sinensis]